MEKLLYDAAMRIMKKRERCCPDVEFLARVAQNCSFDAGVAVSFLEVQ